MDLKKIVAKVKTKLAADRDFYKMSDIEKFFKDSLRLPLAEFSSTFVNYNPNNGGVKIFSGKIEGEKAEYLIVTDPSDGHLLYVTKIGQKDSKILRFKSAKECFKKIEAIETEKEKIED
jgi:hypothetical protein